MSIERDEAPENPGRNLGGRPRTLPWRGELEELIATMDRSPDGRAIGRSTEARRVTLPGNDVRKTLKALYRAGESLGVSVKTERINADEEVTIRFWTEER